MGGVQHYLGVFDSEAAAAEEYQASAARLGSSRQEGSNAVLSNNSSIGRVASSIHQEELYSNSTPVFAVSQLLLLLPVGGTSLLATKVALGRAIRDVSALNSALADALASTTGDAPQQQLLLSAPSPAALRVSQLQTQIQGRLDLQSRLVAGIHIRMQHQQHKQQLV